MRKPPSLKNSPWSGIPMLSTSKSWFFGVFLWLVLRFPKCIKSVPNFDLILTIAWCWRNILDCKKRLNIFFYNLREYFRPEGRIKHWPTIAYQHFAPWGGPLYLCWGFLILSDRMSLCPWGTLFFSAITAAINSLFRFYVFYFSASSACSGDYSGHW